MRKGRKENSNEQDTIDPYTDYDEMLNSQIVSQESEWELEEALERPEGLPINFDYYFELNDSNPYQDSYSWHEMSYYNECTSWNDFEKTELEIFEEEEGIL